jgi:hypothetical protein
MFRSTIPESGPSETSKEATSRGQFKPLLHISVKANQSSLYSRKLLTRLSISLDLTPSFFIRSIYVWYYLIFPTRASFWFCSFCLSATSLFSSSFVRFNFDSNSSLSCLRFYRYSLFLWSSIFIYSSRIFPLSRYFCWSFFSTRTLSRIP